MKFYRISLIANEDQPNNGEHRGFHYTTSRSEAVRYLKGHKVYEQELQLDQFPIINVINVKPTRAGILEALNTYADHPNNG
jgi:hypothetical protein